MTTTPVDGTGDSIENLGHESRHFPPSAEFVAQANFKVSSRLRLTGRTTTFFLTSHPPTSPQEFDLAAVCAADDAARDIR